MASVSSGQTLRRTGLLSKPINEPRNPVKSLFSSRAPRSMQFPGQQPQEPGYWPVGGGGRGAPICPGRRLPFSLDTGNRPTQVCFAFPQDLKVSAWCRFICFKKEMRTREPSWSCLCQIIKSEWQGTLDPLIRGPHFVGKEAGRYWYVHLAFPHKGAHGLHLPPRPCDCLHGLC